MIVVANPVDMVRENAETTAQRVLQTDMTNITMSQWQVEPHDEDDAKYVVFCAVNRRLDPMDAPYMLHMKAHDFDHLKLMFHYVDYVAGNC